nr:MFS transporter [Nocardia coubleae]
MPADISAPAAKERTPTVIRVLVLATFVVILNETIMINAIPRLMEDLKVTEVAAQWVSTAFMLTMAAIIPTTGWFLQRVTTRTAYATAMATFMAGTVLSAVAPTFAVLLIGRIIQAGGTAVMMPLLMTTLMTVVAEKDRGRVMGNVTLAISVAPAMGPVVSGLVLQISVPQIDSWRLLFVLMLPITGIVTWLGLRQLENVGEPVRHQRQLRSDRQSLTRPFRLDARCGVARECLSARVPVDGDLLSSGRCFHLIDVFVQP